MSWKSSKHFSRRLVAGQSVGPVQILDTLVWDKVSWKNTDWDFHEIRYWFSCFLEDEPYSNVFGDLCHPQEKKKNITYTPDLKSSWGQSTMELSENIHVPQMITLWSFSSPADLKMPNYLFFLMISHSFVKHFHTLMEINHVNFNDSMDFPIASSSRHAKQCSPNHWSL